MDETMTVEELIKELKKIHDKSMKVYMLTDISVANWDEETCQYKKVYPVYTAEKQIIPDLNGWEDENEEFLMLTTNEEMIWR